MRVVFLDQYGSLGGGQQVLLELVRGAVACGHTITVLIPPGPCTQKLQAQGATVLPLPVCSLSQGKKSVFDALCLFFYTLRVFWVYFHTLRQADFLYVNGNRLLPVAFVTSLLLGKRAAYHIHLHHEGKERALFALVLRHRYTRALVLASPYIHEQLVAYSPRFADARVRVLENGLDARFADIPFVDRFTGKNITHIAIVGRVSPEKGQDVVLELAPQFPHITFHILGDAAFSSHNFAQSLRRNAPSNICFHGWVDDIPQKIDALQAQICLVPSRCLESFGLVCIEMTALSCLVLVRHTGALASMARTLRLPSFRDDADIAPLLAHIQQRTPQDICHSVHTSYTQCQQFYGHDVFHARICALWRTLLA